MLNFAHVASSPTATSTDEPKLYSAPTQLVSRTQLPRAELFTSVETSPAFNAFALLATLHGPDSTEISGKPIEKPSHPSPKPHPTPPNTDLAPTSHPTLRSFPTSCHHPATINHSLTPSKISPPKGLIKNHSTSVSSRKTHIYSHS